jgi:hypothetical protein
MPKSKKKLFDYSPIPWEKYFTNTTTIETHTGVRGYHNNRIKYLSTGRVKQDLI